MLGGAKPVANTFASTPVTKYRETDNDHVDSLASDLGTQVAIAFHLKQLQQMLTCANIQQLPDQGQDPLKGLVSVDLLGMLIHLLHDAGATSTKRERTFAKLPPLSEGP